MIKAEILKRLYADYTKKFLNKIIISVFFSVLVAGSTSAIAWLLDPAIKKLFIEKQQSLINDYEIYTSEGWSPIIRVIRPLSRSEWRPKNKS